MRLAILLIYKELQGGVWDFVKLCKAAKAANMKVPQVVNLLNIANTSLPSVQHRYEMIQRQNNTLESIIRTKAREVQNLKVQINNMGQSLDRIKSEYTREAAVPRFTTADSKSAAICV
jgi:uncharacterized protein YoxC